MEYNKINFYDVEFRYNSHIERMLVENTICLIVFYQKKHNPTRDRINNYLEKIYTLGLIDKRMILTVGGRLIEKLGSEVQWK